MRYTFLLAFAAGLAGWGQAAKAQDFNPYVLRAVNELHTKYRGGGYDIRHAFTHDIPYGNSVIRKTSSLPPVAPTMCVAAVAEVMLTAISLHAQDHGLNDVNSPASPYNKVPASLFTRGNLLSLRANLFMFAGTGSRGTGHTLQRFGLGRELGFSQLKSGDFVNLNRTSRSGHAVVFLGYLDANGNDLSTFGPAVKGFRYFSAQGKGKPDAGFGYRNAYFEGTCPPSTATRIRDCHVIRSNNPQLLNAGRMMAPNTWTIQAALVDLRRQQGRAIASVYPSATRAVINQELERELPNSIDPLFDGVEGE